MPHITKPIVCFDTGEVFNNYRDYLLGNHWKEVKQKYKRSKLPQHCNVCDSKIKLHLHHKTYKRIGKERLTDLIYLCEKCHSFAHDKLRNDHSQKLNLWTIAKRMKKVKDSTQSKYSIKRKPKKYDKAFQRKR